MHVVAPFSGYATSFFFGTFRCLRGFSGCCSLFTVELHCYRSLEWSYCRCRFHVAQARFCGSAYGDHLKDKVISCVRFSPVCPSFVAACSWRCRSLTCRVLQDSWRLRRMWRRNPNTHMRARRRQQKRQSRSRQDLLGLAAQWLNGLPRRSRRHWCRVLSPVHPRLHDQRPPQGSRAVIVPRGHGPIALRAYGRGGVRWSAVHARGAATGDDERQKPLVALVVAALRGMRNRPSHRSLHRHHPQDRRGKAKAPELNFVPIVGLRSNLGQEALASVSTCIGTNHVWRGSGSAMEIGVWRGTKPWSLRMTWKHSASRKLLLSRTLSFRPNPCGIVSPWRRHITRGRRRSPFHVNGRKRSGVVAVIEALRRMCAQDQKVHVVVVQVAMTMQIGMAGRLSAAQRQRRFGSRYRARPCGARTWLWSVDHLRAQQKKVSGAFHLVFWPFFPECAEPDSWCAQGIGCLCFMSVHRGSFAVYLCIAAVLWFKSFSGVMKKQGDTRRNASGIDISSGNYLYG